jgi:polysaccharide export outer membrane protein
MRTLKTCFLMLALALTGASCLAQTESITIGPGDTLHVQFYDTPDLEQHPRVSDDGNIYLLMLGNIHVAGLSANDAARAIETAFKSKGLMRQPQVVLTIETYATQGVVVTGQVHTPGAFPIATPRSVVDVLALAGGIADDGDRHITIERHTTKERVSYFLSAQPGQALDTAVMIYPGDTIIVPKAPIVYVLGDVGHPGGYVMSSPSSDSKLSVMQMVALAGGTQSAAVPSKTRLLRKQPDGSYQEIPVPLSDMQKGKASDIAMQANDVLYVPFSFLRNFIANQSGGLAGSTASAAIYHF